MTVDTLLRQRTDIWRGAGARFSPDGIPTGFEALDMLLPTGGWPRGALTEILTSGEGSGSLQLLLPALSGLSRTPLWLAWVAPPHIPYAPALAEAGIRLEQFLLIQPRGQKECLWALQQTLKSGNCSAVLGWPSAIADTDLRRLQLAAETGNAWGVIFRAATDAQRSSAAAVRLLVEPSPCGIRVRIVKRRGGWPTPALILKPVNLTGVTAPRLLVHN